MLIHEGSSLSSNASMTLNLTQNQTYYIVSGFNDDTKSGTYGLIVENAPVGNITLNNPEIINFKDNYYIFTFSPNITN